MKKLICSVCKDDVNDIKEHLKCLKCKKHFHLDCIGVSQKRFDNLMSREQKAIWKCRSCRPINNQDKVLHTNNAPGTSREKLSTIITSSPSNITLRRPTRLRKRLTSIEPTDSEFESQTSPLMTSNDLLDGSSRSLPNISTIENQTEIELNTEITNLKVQLASAHDEIDRLNEEVTSLKKIFEDKLKQMDIYKKLLTEPGPPRIITPTKNKQTIKRTQVNVNDSPVYKNRVEDPASSAISSAKTKSDGASNAPKTPVQKRLAAHNYSPKLPKEEKSNSKIMIFSDEQGTGIAEKLIKNSRKFIIKTFDVQSFMKPGADTEEVLKPCKNMCQNLTTEDYVILMIGSNDSNPYKVMAEISATLKLLNNCNVFVINVMRNCHVNEYKLNANIQLLTRNFSNCSFIHTNYEVVDIIINEINKLQYSKKFLSCGSLKVNRIQSVRSRKNLISDYFKQKNDKFSGNAKSSKPISTLNQTDKPRKGTIGYYFKPINKNINSTCDSNNTLFRE